MPSLSRMYRLISVALAAVLLASCAMMGQPSVPTASEALAADPELSELTQALADAGLVDDVEGAESITIFAPTNDAFAAHTPQRVSLADTLLYHVVEGAAEAGQLADGGVLETLYANSTLGVVVDGDVFLVDGGAGAVVVANDIEIANGVIHKIDTVLTPPAPITTIASEGGLTSLVDALVAAALAGEFDEPTDGPYTVFAPTEAAFAELLSALGYADLNALVASFGAEQVGEILQYHVIEGVVGEADVASVIGAGGTLTTLLGRDLSLSVDSEGRVMISNPNGVADATVTATNIVTANGVVHLVDAVLVPELAGPTSATYALDATGNLGTNVSGTVTFTKLSDTETEVAIDLEGTPEGGSHPAHVHVGDMDPGGAMWLSIGPVDGTTGQSTVTISQTDGGDPVSFEDIIALDGYVNVHLSAEDVTIVAEGETGEGATIVAP